MGLADVPSGRVIYACMYMLAVQQFFFLIHTNMHNVMRMYICFHMTFDTAKIQNCLKEDTAFRCILLVYQPIIHLLSMLCFTAGRGAGCLLSTGVLGLNFLSNRLKERGKKRRRKKEWICFRIHTTNRKF